VDNFPTDEVTGLVIAATLTENTPGNYTITVTGAGPLALTNHRWLFRVQDSAERETRTYFYADFPASPFAAPAAVTAQACTNCHGPEGIGIHGSAFIAGESGEVCLTCHGADDSPFGDPPGPNPVPGLAFVVHGVHNSSNHPDGEWVYDARHTFHVTYPTYMNNCSVCHETVDQLAVANSMALTDDNCFTCHFTTEGIPFEEGSTAETFHANIVDGCQSCHAGQITGIPQTVTQVHNGATTERGGVIWQGEDTSITEGALIDWQIIGVIDDGTNLTINWQASYDGTPYDPCNDVPSATVPFAFHEIPPLTRPDGTTQNRNNLSIIRNYAQGEDFILGKRADGAGQPGTTPRVEASNTTCAGNVATTVVPVEETNATVGRVGIQGKPWVVAIDPDDADGVMQVRAKSPTFDWVVGTGNAATARRNVVDSGLCLNCHRGSLYQHGGNRVDNIDLCMLCHNVAANDEYVRVDEFGVDASESYDGRAGQAFGMKELAHGVHPARATGNPLVVYRGRGIYAWATNVGQLRNWPTGANCTQGDGDTGSNYFTVVGSEVLPEGSDTCQPHNFHAPTFPRGLYDCAACHVQDDPATSTDEGFALLPNPRVAMATTVEAGAPPFGEQDNDVLQGVQTTSCVSCHADGATKGKGHAYQNSWTPQAFPEGRKTIIDAN
jgi:OmcA/MtrC family decaheme c-type cytochrome